MKIKEIITNDPELSLKKQMNLMYDGLWFLWQEQKTLIIESDQDLNEQEKSYLLSLSLSRWLRWDLTDQQKLDLRGLENSNNPILSLARSLVDEFIHDIWILIWADIREKLIVAKYLSFSDQLPQQSIHSSEIAEILN